MTIHQNCLHSKIICWVIHMPQKRRWEQSE